MNARDSEGGSPAPDDQSDEGEGTQSPSSLPSGAGPQADGEQSDISSGGGTSA